MSIIPPRNSPVPARTKKPWPARVPFGVTVRWTFWDGMVRLPRALPWAFEFYAFGVPTFICNVDTRSPRRTAAAPNGPDSNAQGNALGTEPPRHTIEGPTGRNQERTK